MHQMYAHIVETCQKALADYNVTQELLEYPEVQADKAYYLSVLNKFNKLQQLASKLQQLTKALDGERALTAALPTLSEEERAMAYEELAELRNSQMKTAEQLALALGCNTAQERVFCRLLCTADSAAACEGLYSLVKQDLLSHGASILQENLRGKTVTEEISFTAQGSGIAARLKVLSGTHRVLGATTGEIAIAVTPAAATVEVEEKDFKIDLFHSGGAGGQNINKVETAVRVTHLPTGTVVTCQDERSQLKNKRRAMETIKQRLAEQNADLEKKRMDSDIKLQLKCNSALTFSPGGQFSDKRIPLKNATLTAAEFTTYVNTLIAKER